MASQTMSMRVTDEVQELFKSSANASGLKHEEFLVKLLSTYAQHGDGQEETNVTQEKAQVRAGLERTRVLVEAVIDRANDQSRQAEDQIKTKTEAFNDRLKELQEELKSKDSEISSLKSENNRLTENAESRFILKQAFDEKLKTANEQVKNLQDQIELLQKAVEEKDVLEEKITEYENTIRDMELNFQKEINKIMESEKEKMQTFILKIQGKNG